jgi:hypothetical protein
MCYIVFSIQTVTGKTRKCQVKNTGWSVAKMQVHNHMQNILNVSFIMMDIEK